MAKGRYETYTSTVKLRKLDPKKIRQLGTSTLGVLYPNVNAILGVPIGHYNISWRGLAALLILGKGNAKA